jgi:hypothetical protein
MKTHNKESGHQESKFHELTKFKVGFIELNQILVKTAAMACQ